MNGRIRACKCTHDRASHYRDSSGEGNCLVRGCDCAGFTEPDSRLNYPKQVEEREPPE